MSYNGVDLEPYLTVLKVYRPGTADITNETRQVATRGLSFKRQRRGGKTIKVDIFIAGNVLETIDILNDIFADYPAKLVFSDQPDRYYLATLSKFPEPSSSVREAELTLEFESFDGVAHSVAYKRFDNPKVEGDRLVFEVENKGNETALPIIRLKSNSDNGYYGMVNDSGAMAVGNKEEMDGKTVEKSVLEFDYRDDKILTGFEKGAKNQAMSNVAENLTGTLGTLRFNGRNFVYLQNYSQQGVNSSGSLTFPITNSTTYDYIWWRQLFWSGPDQKRTIEWTGQDTKLKRLISLANNFDAEIAFETYLNDDSSLKVFRLNVFKEHDDTHQGVGARRDDIILDYDENIEKITRTVDKTTIFNVIHPVGGDKTITRKVTKTRTVYKTVTVSGGGAGNTENALRNIESRKGQRVGTGQCYALSALYSALLGGPGLGGGVTGISGRIGAGIAASNIGTDYRWGAFGWAVVGNEVSNAKAGAIVNIRANYGSPFWTGPYGHTAIIKAVSGSTITVLEQNYAGRMYVVENSYNLSAYMAGVQTVCFPPEIAAGKTVGGQAVTKQIPVQETYTEDVKETVKTVIPSDKYKEYKNDAGEVEFYVKNGNIYAPISAKLYPAVLSGKEIGDNWIRKDISVETTDEAVLEATALRTIRAGCYPAITYDVKGDADLAPGDTVKVHDNQFFPVLLLEMRASEVHRSFSDPDQGHTVFTNFKVIENKLPSDLLSRMEEMADAKAPYTIRLSSDNGTAFKNNEGETLFKADLYKGEKLVATDVSWRWALDGVVTVGMQYLVKAKDIDETAVLTVSGYVGNTEVATTEITLTNINDGKDGIKGDKGDKGDTGNGIANTVITYGLSTSEITEPTTWASNMPVLVKGMYLWTRTVQIYTNGTSSTSYQKGYIAKDGAQGLPGTPGKDAQTQYTHIAYADNAIGGGFSLTDNTKTYWGMYQDFNAANSNDPTKYKWSKWKGDQGLPGKPGADGKTSYFHMAYASSADGRTGFSFTDTKQQYQGYYTDFTQTSSIDPTKYTWMDRRAGVEVGGVNLLTNRPTNWQNKYVVISGASAGSFLQQNSTTRISPKEFVAVEAGKQYTVSLKELTDADYYFKVTMSTVDDYGTANSRLNEDEWIRTETYTFTAPENCKYVMISVGCDDGVVSDDLNTKFNIKVEEGNVPTAYSKSPEDVQADIDSKADSVLTQQQLNALAEKNRNMEAEMAAKASLAEVERWKQAYDEYVAQNDADKTSAEQKLITLTSRVAEWVKDWEDKKVQWSFLDTNMDFGEEGLRLGKKGSPTSILISNDRIGFYSGGSEVASMSNGTLTIDNGIFAKSLQIGHYREEVYEGDKTINVIRWID